MLGLPGLVMLVDEDKNRCIVVIVVIVKLTIIVSRVKISGSSTFYRNQVSNTGSRYTLGPDTH